MIRVQRAGRPLYQTTAPKLHVREIPDRKRGELIMTHPRRSWPPAERVPEEGKNVERP